jgi:hypothetical protein
MDRVVVTLRSRPQGLPRWLLYKRASRLFTDPAQARGEDRLPRLMSALERTRLLLPWWPGGEAMILSSIGPRPG